jgi:hypothetical protein
MSTQTMKYEVRHFLSAQDKRGHRVALFLNEEDAKAFVEKCFTSSNDLEYQVIPITT